MSQQKVIDPALYAVGRGAVAAPVALFLHQVGSYDEALTGALDCQEPGCHSSFHVLIDSKTSRFQRFLAAADTAFSFTNPNTSTCPGATDPCCELDPANPVFTGAPVGATANQLTLNVGVAFNPLRFKQGDCATDQCFTDRAYKNLVAETAKLLIAAGLTASATTIFKHVIPASEECGCKEVTEVACLDLTQFIADVLAWTPPPAIVGTDICSQIGTLTPGTPATVVGKDLAGNCVIGSVAAAAAPTLALTSPVNQISIVYNGIPQTADIVETVVAAVAANDLTVTVNGVASAPVPVITSNVLAAGATATELTSTVNGIASAFDLQPIVNAALCPAIGQLTPAATAAGTDEVVIHKADGTCSLVPLSGILPTVTLDDQVLSSADGLLVFTPTAPAGPDGQVDYSVTFSPTYFCDQITGLTPGIVTTIVGQDATGACVKQAYTPTVLTGVGIKGDGTLAAPIEFEASELPSDVSPASLFIVASTTASPDGALVSTPTIVCDGLKQFNVVPYDGTLPLQFLQRDAANDCTIVEVPPANLASCVPLERALTANGFQLISPTFRTTTLGTGGIADATLYDHVKALGDVTVTNSGNCERQIRITNVSPGGADINVTLILNGVADTLVLPGFNNATFVQFTTASGNTRQGASLSIDVLPTGDSTIF